MAWLAWSAGQRTGQSGASGGSGLIGTGWRQSGTLTIAHAAGLGFDTSYAPLWYPASVLDPVGVPFGALPSDPNLCVTSDRPCTQYLPASFPSWTSPRDTPPP
ncbi:hypothetical protein WEI85_04855 [Actinomycetes bacterium KLBMP 9797]